MRDEGTTRETGNIPHRTPVDGAKSLAIYAALRAFRASVATFVTDSAFQKIRLSPGGASPSTG